jgi:hypothetical protein
MQIANAGNQAPMHIVHNDHFAPSSEACKKSECEHSSHFQFQERGIHTDASLAAVRKVKVLTVLYTVSASAYFPLALSNPAVLAIVVATSGWFLPSWVT